MPAAILLPASFVAFRAERLLFAVADGLDTACNDSQCTQSSLHRAGTLVAQGQVELGRSALVAVSFDRYIDIRVLTEELRVGLQRRLLVATNIRLVVVEVDVLDVLTEQVFVAHRGSWWRRRRRRLRHGQPRGGLLRATCTLGGEVIGGGIRRRHALRAVRLHRANAI